VHTTAASRDTAKPNALHSALLAEAKWEYRLESIPQAGFATRLLNDLGEERLELVAIVGTTFYLKRERTEARTPK
jgi:hypothetical protein